MKSSQWIGKKDRIPAKECHRHSQDTTNPHSTARCSCKKTRACHFPQQKHSGNWRGKTACFTTPFPSCSTPKTPQWGKEFSFTGPKNHRHQAPKRTLLASRKRQAPPSNSSLEGKNAAALSLPLRQKPASRNRLQLFFPSQALSSKNMRLCRVLEREHRCSFPLRHGKTNMCSAGCCLSRRELRQFATSTQRVFDQILALANFSPG